MKGSHFCKILLFQQILSEMSLAVVFLFLFCCHWEVSSDSEVCDFSLPQETCVLHLLLPDVLPVGANNRMNYRDEIIQE